MNAKPAGHLTAEIVTTGTEILLGEIVDTNAAWIAQQLRESGINLYYKTTVGDNQARLQGVVELAMSRSDAVIVTGGLGPTVDDVTRQAIAAATARPLQLHAGALATLQARFARFGVEMTENNKQQAYIPEGALLIENPVGTAPGFIVETARCAVIAVPGVPREMMHLITATVLPYLRARGGNLGIIRRRVLRTIGIGESTIDHDLGELMHLANPTVGLAAHVGQVDVRITASAATEAEVEAMLDGLEAEVRQRIGRHIYSTTPKEPFADVVARLLQERDATVALVETNTQGSIARILGRALPAASPVKAAWTWATLPAALRAALLGSEEPAPAPRVGEDVALRAAELARTESGATFGLAVLGTSGEQEGVFGQEAGETWVALANPQETRSWRIPYGGADEQTLIRIGNQALVRLWRALAPMP